MNLVNVVRTRACIGRVSCRARRWLQRTVLIFLVIAGGTIGFSHFRGDLSHVKLFKIRTALQAELSVAFLVENRISIESQLRQLVAVFKASNVFELVNSIV